MSDTYKFTKLNNDLGFLHILNKKNKILSLGFIVNVGSRDERKHEYGISHFLEHMLFKTTHNRSTRQLLLDLDSLGTTYNAQTSHEHTFYELHGNVKDWKKLVDILLELYLCSKCYKNDIETERGVILEEYNMVNNNIDEYSFDVLSESIYGNSPLGRPIIGTVKNIKQFDRKLITEFRNKYYSFPNTTIVIVGNIRNNDLKKYLNNKIKKLKKIQTNTKFINARDHYFPIQHNPRVTFRNTDKSGQTQLLLGFHYDGYLKNDYSNYLDLISLLLTGGSSSRLFDLLRTKMGVAYSVSAYNAEYEDSSIFLINSAVDENKTDIVVNGILNVLIKIKKREITNTEFKKIKRIYTNNLMMLENDNAELLHYYAEHIVRKTKIKTIKDLQNLTSKINPNKLKKVINHVFRRDNLNLVLIGHFQDKQKKKIVNCLDDWGNM